MSFLIFVFIHLFIFGCGGSLLLCVGHLQFWPAGAPLCGSVRASHGAGLSGCSSRTSGLQQLRHTGPRKWGSVVGAYDLSWTMARGTFPRQRSNPCPLHWQVDSYPLCHQESPSVKCWDMTSKTTHKLDFIKIKDFCALKDTIKRIKNQSIQWGKFLQITYLTKNMYPKQIQNSPNSAIRKYISQLGNKLKIWADTSPKKLHKWQISTWNRCSASLVTREKQIKPQWNITTYLLKLLKQRLTRLSAGKAVEKLELSYVAGRNVKWSTVLESSLAVKHILSTDPAVSLLGIYLSEMKTYIQISICMFIQNHQILETTSLSLSWRVEKLRHILTREYYSTVKGTNHWYLHQPWINFNTKC